LRPFLLIALAASLSGCFRHFALSSAADAVSSSGGSYGRDDDPELVRAAVPFGLKTMEGLAQELPEHVGLRVALARGFTQYAYAFVQADADPIAESEPSKARPIYARATRLYLRARDYGLEGLQAARGVSEAELRGPKRAAALSKLEKDEVPLLYWTAAAWGAAIALNKGNMALVGDLAAIQAMLARALELDEAYDRGSLHEFSLALGSGRAPAAEQEKHYQRALQLSEGRRLSLFVSRAENILQPARDKAGFVDQLQKVMAFDVNDPKVRDDRLANLLAQRRAAFLLGAVSDLFPE
jgi:hypothetical protein